MRRIIGIDYGKARIGIAISDPFCKIALPLKTLSSSSNPEQAALIVCNFIESEKLSIQGAVLGLPLHLNGKESDMSALVRLFKACLEKKLSFPIRLVDERFSSALVEKDLKKASFSRKKRAEKSDTASACLILQEYLSSLNLM